MSEQSASDTLAKPKRQRLSIEQKIARLDAQMAKLRAKAQKRSRQQETREKIVVGATVLNAMRADDELRHRVAALLNDNVKRDIDREAVAAWLSDISASR